MRIARRLMLPVGIAAAAAFACGRDTFGHKGTPPVPPGLVFAAISSAVPTIAAGTVSVPVQAVFFNGGTTSAIVPPVSLFFEDSAGNPIADFVARTDPQGVAAVVGSGATLSVPFAVEVPVSLALGSVHVRGTASTLVSQTDLTWGVSGMTEILVDTTADSIAADGRTSLREAILAANAAVTDARISFSPAVFPAAAPATITLVLTTGAAGTEVLPEIHGEAHRVIVDGTHRGVRVKPGAALKNDARFGFHITGQVELAGLTFAGMGDLYPTFDVSTDDCAGNEQTGGAVIADGVGTVVAHNVFDGTGVAERNCYAREVQWAGGGGHRILDNVFIALPGDAGEAYAPVAEISRNLVLPSTDDGFIINILPPTPMLIAENVVIGQQCSGLYLSPSNQGTAQVWNNTLVGSGLTCGGGAGMRLDGGFFADVRNNALQHNAVGIELSGGVTAALTHSSSYAEPFLVDNDTGNDSVIRDASVSTAANILLTGTNGNSFASFAPQAASPLVDSGENLVDMNGDATGTFNGAASDRGAVER